MIVILTKEDRGREVDIKSGDKIYRLEYLDGTDAKLLIGTYVEYENTKKREADK